MDRPLAYTDIVEWLLAMRSFADANPDMFWLSSDQHPFVQYMAYNRDDPDPAHVRTFSVTLGALRRVREGVNDEFAELLRPRLLNSQTRIKIATDLNDPGHPLINALLDKARSG